MAEDEVVYVVVVRCWPHGYVYSACACVRDDNIASCHGGTGRGRGRSLVSKYS